MKGLTLSLLHLHLHFAFAFWIQISRQKFGIFPIQIFEFPAKKKKVLPVYTTEVIPSRPLFVEQLQWSLTLSGSGNKFKPRPLFLPNGICLHMFSIKADLNFSLKHGSLLGPVIYIYVNI